MDEPTTQPPAQPSAAAEQDAVIDGALAIALDKLQYIGDYMCDSTEGDDWHLKCVAIDALEEIKQARATPSATPPAQQDAVDAERWRFLREQHEDEAESFCVFGPNGVLDCLEPVGSLLGELDEAIDAAISAKKGGAV